jgi:hypothetical protein
VVITVLVDMLTIISKHRAMDWVGQMEEKHHAREMELRQKEEEQRLAQERYRQEAWEHHLVEVR